MKSIAPSDENSNERDGCDELKILRTSADDNYAEPIARAHAEGELTERRAVVVTTPARRVFISRLIDAMRLSRTGRVLAGLTFLGFLLRLLCLRLDHVLTPDGTLYVMLARQLAAGNFRSGLSPYSTPLYPLLVSAASFLFGDIVLSGRLVSILAGGLLVLPVYFLIRRAHGRRVATCGAALVAIHPLLIYYSTEVLTESAYTLFFVCGVYAGWQALSTKRTRPFVLAGLSFGLCYLLKPEAIGFVLLLLALALWRGLKSKAASRKRLLTDCLWLLTCFLSLALPYLIYIRATTGTWTISAKLSRHMWQGSRLGERALSAGGELLPGLSVMFAQTAKALRSEYELLNLIFPPTFIALIALGLFARRWTRRRARYELYLLLFITATLAGYAITLPNIRFFVPLVPLTFGWIAKGAVEGEKWLQQTLSGMRKVKTSQLKGSRLKVSRLSRASFISFAVVLLVLSIVPLFVYLVRGDKWSDYMGQRQAALWIKEQARVERPPHIMSTVPLPAFYADGVQVEMPDEDYAAFVERARRARVDYIVINERDIRRTRLWPLLYEDSEHPGLHLVYQQTNTPGHKILIYVLAN